MATAQADLGDWPAARKSAAEALQIRRREDPDDPKAAMNLVVLARARIASGETEAARRLLEQSRELAQRIPGGDPELLEEIEQLRKKI